MAFIYGLIVPLSLHMAPFLEMALPAFKGPDLLGLLPGLDRELLYGVYAELMFVPIYSFLARWWRVPVKQ